MRLALIRLRIEPLNHLFTAQFWNTCKKSFTASGTMKRQMRANRSHDAKGPVCLHAIITNHSQFYGQTNLIISPTSLAILTSVLGQIVRLTARWVRLAAISIVRGVNCRRSFWRSIRLFPFIGCHRRWMVCFGQLSCPFSPIGVNGRAAPAKVPSKWIIH